MPSDWLPWGNVKFEVLPIKSHASCPKKQVYVKFPEQGEVSYNSFAETAGISILFQLKQPRPLPFEFDQRTCGEVILVADVTTGAWWLKSVLSEGLL